MVFGRTDGDPTAQAIGVQVSRDGGTRARIDGDDCRFAGRAARMRFPVQVIDPGVHKLVEEGPALAAGAGWTGVCSTWNLDFVELLGAVSARRSSSATRR